MSSKGNEWRRPWRRDPVTLGKSMAALLVVLREGKLVAGPGHGVPFACNPKIAMYVCA